MFRFINIEFGTFIVTRRIIRNIIRIISDYKRKTGISPLLANKDRGTSFRRLLWVMDRRNIEKYCQELLTS